MADDGDASNRSAIDARADSVAAATEILANAIRLFRDANLLFANARYPSCTSLAVLSLEELAKFLALVGLQPLPLQKWRDHNAKHLSPASFLLRKTYQSALGEVLADTPDGEREEKYKRLADMDYRDEDAPLFDAVLARLAGGPALGRFSEAYIRGLDRLKQSGFYVDTDDTLKVRSSPTKITREIAEAQLQFVREVFATIRANI